MFGVLLLEVSAWMISSTVVGRGSSGGVVSTSEGLSFSKMHNTGVSYVLTLNHSLFFGLACVGGGLWATQLNAF